MRASNPPSHLWQKQERRRYPRQKVESLVYLNVQPNNGGILLDFSESGICISVANPLPVSSQIHFSLGSGDGGVVEGTGQISWLSGSGRRAGVRFVQFPNDSRKRIREWLAGENLPAEREQPSQRQEDFEPAVLTQAATESAGPVEQARPQESTRNGQETAKPVMPQEEASNETRSAAATEEQPPTSWRILFAPPQRPDAMPPKESSPPSESEVAHQKPETPLFFLSQKQRWEPDRDLPADDGEQEARKNGEEQIAAFRSAIASRPSGEKEKERDRRLLRNALLGVTISGALLGLVVLGAFYHPNFSSGFDWLTSMVRTSTVSVTANTIRHNRPVRRAATPTGTSQRTERGSRPVRDVTTFYAPRPDEARFPAERNNPARNSWLATVTSERTVPNQPPPGTGNATRSAVGGAGPTQPADLSSPMISHSQLTGHTGVMYTDGALVVEGAVPFSPSDSADERIVPKPIVVEAVIGRDGRVKNVQLVSSPASRLAQAVVKAVEQWHYRPFYRNGQPVEFTTRITFDFSRPLRKP